MDTTILFGEATIIIKQRLSSHEYNEKKTVEVTCKRTFKNNTIQARYLAFIFRLFKSNVEGLRVLIEI